MHPYHNGVLALRRLLSVCTVTGTWRSDDEVVLFLVLGTPEEIGPERMDPNSVLDDDEFTLVVSHHLWDSLQGNTSNSLMLNA